MTEKHKFELSEFNINSSFKDQHHVELLKRQIEAGYDLPIEVYKENGVYKIIDGGHAWAAYNELNREPKNVRILTFKDDAEKIAYSRHKNINRLQQTPVTYTKSIFQELKMRLRVETDEEVKKILRRLYNLKRQPERYNETDDDKHKVVFIEEVFKNESVTWESFTVHNIAYLDFPLWLAEMVDRGELTAAQALILNKKEVTDKLDEEKRKLLAALLRGKSVKETEKGIVDILRFEPPLYNVWNFSECNPLFGMDYPSRIPGQIVQRVLFLYSEEGDLVVDPMAGGGTTKDVCKVMNRNCLAYDINPSRDDIILHDIRSGYPEETKDCDLVFLDPPYWRLEKENYSEQSVSNLSFEDWLNFMEKLAQDTSKTVKKGGYVALLLTPFYDEKVTGKFLDLSFICISVFLKNGFIQVQRISVPMTSEIKSVQDVQYAKQRKILLDLNRDLIIFRRAQLDS